MADRPSIFGLVFKEAVEIFRGNVRRPKDALLADFQEAIVKAIEEGTAFNEFLKDFDRIVARHGWNYRGAREWRARVIFQTNLHAAYQAGRWQQMQSTARRRPYLRYVGILDDRIRPMHRAWHGTILPIDHPWWKTHYPPNGWNCRCSTMQLSERDLAREGWTVSVEPPPGGIERRSIKTPEGRIMVEVPEGIDPGFACNVGESGWAVRIDTPPEGDDQ